MKLAVMGAAGRMGRALIRALRENENCTMAGAIERPGSPSIGKDAGEIAGLAPLGIAIVDDPVDVIARVDGVLDFTAPAVSLRIARLAARSAIVHVIGTTGFSADEEKELTEAARHATLVKSGNMSLGVNIVAVLTEKIAQALGPDFDIEIAEIHHRHKVDAPSGTARLLGEAASAGRGIELGQAAITSRVGHTGERQAGAIGFASLRGGSVVGDHTVIFAGDGERIELTHRAEDRAIFARGAIRAALWGRNRGPGLFTMRDVLGM